MSSRNKTEINNPHETLYSRVSDLLLTDVGSGDNVTSVLAAQSYNARCDI